MGGVAAVIVVIGIITFVRRRNRPTDSIRADPDSPETVDSTSSASWHTSSLPVTETGGLGVALPYDTRRRLVHSSEIESWLERLRVGGIVFRAPPSYDTEGNE